MRWYFCWLGRGRVYILHVKQTWITWDQKVGLVAGLQDSSEFLRQFAPVIPAVWYSYPWVAPSFTILQLVCVINSSRQKWCYVISEKRLWKIVTSIWISPIPASRPPSPNLGLLPVGEVAFLMCTVQRKFHLAETSGQEPLLPVAGDESLEVNSLTLLQR